MIINKDSEARELDIAVTGIAMRFPGADTAEEFWDNIKNGKEALTHFSDEEMKATGVKDDDINNEHYVKAGFVIDDIDKFDASFFGVTPREARLMDPQLRVLLQTAWHALEDAGCDPDRYKGKIGVFAGAGLSQYLLKNLMTSLNIENPDIMRTVWIGNDTNYLSTTLSYKLNLQGPSVTVQSACSTSLTAIGLAVQSLQDYQCDMALAGGVKLQLPMKGGYLYIPGEVMSPDGHCRPFDKDGMGTVSGNGVGMVVLKRLEDAINDHDHIIAVVKGVAINNDGKDKIGYTAPSIKGEENAVQEALLIGEVDPDSVTYLETHGTGTPLGDPIEIQALTEAYRKYTNNKQYCALGTVKANIGHLDTAAGVAGFIKTCLVLANKQLPPCINFNTPNPNINFEDTPFYVNNELKEWNPKCGVRRAGVSSFGIGGTNVHAVLEEAIDERKTSSSRNMHLLLVSGKTESSVKNEALNLSEFIKKHKKADLANICYTMNTGRKQQQIRSFFVASDKDGMLDVLNRPVGCTKSVPDDGSNAAFLFPGQGTQYMHMAKDVYENEPVFRMAMNRCSELLQPIIGKNLIDMLYGDEADEEHQEILRRTENTHVVLFSVEYSMAKLLMSWGINPSVMLGHSIGEYVAACISGVFTQEEALYIVAMRGRIIGKLPCGRMLSAEMPVEEARKYEDSENTISVINGESLVVFSGSYDSIEKLRNSLSDNYSCRILQTSHAFHSHMLAGGVDEFRNCLGKIEFKEPKIPYLSNVTGNWIRKEDACDPEYWIKHLIGTVHFYDCLKKLKESNIKYYIEVGGGNALTTFVKKCIDDKVFCSIETIRHPKAVANDEAFLLKAVGMGWSYGMNIDIDALYKDNEVFKVSLPGYPFDEKVYWQSAGKNQADARNEAVDPAYEVRNEDNAENADNNLLSRIGIAAEYVAPENELEKSIVEIMEEVIGVKGIGVLDNFFELGGHSLSATQIASRIRDLYGIEIQIGDFMDRQNVRGIADLVFDYLMDDEGGENA